jgi:uncharacterized damage-inducible protein DinB
VNDLLVELFKHNTWANVRMIEFCRDLPPEQRDSDFKIPGTYGSIRDTLLHLVTGEEGYLVTYGRWQEKPNPEFTTWQDLVDRARAAGEAYEKWVAETPAGEALEADFGPQTWKAATWVIQTQLIDHDTEHRTHAGTTLAHMGVQSPPLDLWVYGGETGAVTHWDKT